MAHRGSCHCGRIAFEVDADIAQVIECNCSHCNRKGYLLSFVPREKVRLAIKHHFCPVCGCAPFGFGTDPKGVATAAVNVRCLPELDRSGLTIKRIDGPSR